ncbi:regulatory LuxR family protein [Marinobacter sp. LV10R520-4]|nr:regulatory LuxR family protein [Marinobacter sp. LV10R520-4]
MGELDTSLKEGLNIMEGVKNSNSWQVLQESMRAPSFLELDVDCTAVGIADVNGPIVHFREILFLEGEIHEEPETLKSHCASLVALWMAMRTPSLVDLGQCTCIGRRLLKQEPTLGRRFAVHASQFGDHSLLFAVISSTKRWNNVETVKRIVAELVEQAGQIYAVDDFPPCAPSEQDDVGLDWYQFTTREVQILKLVASGISNKQIARELGSSPNTVRNQIHALFRKTEVTSRTALAMRVAAIK